MNLVDHQSVYSIRRYRVEDVPAFFIAARESKRELGQWFSWCHTDYSISDAKTWVMSRDQAWEQGEAYSFVILDRRNNILLGGVDLNHIYHTHKMANLEYWVRTKETKRGAATAAVRLVAQFGFTTLGLQRLEILVPIANLAGHRVAEKAGAKREGYLRKRLIIHGKPHDVIIHSLVMEDLFSV
ncbi:MAG: GNAT family N-acetyltransferase [Anaerolineae bacterium]|nr:GNAT family N-acetyltransferase [Anaerolineae bacterium]